jgi:cell division protein FtsA
MGSQTENLLTVIDVGSAKTCVIVAAVNDYALRYRGHGISDSRGMRKGVIADLDKAVDSIKKAVEEAENVAQAPVEHAVVGVAGSFIRGVNSHGGITLGSRSREISRDDVRQAVEKARSIAMPEDREALHLLPQEFILDGQGGVRDPAGLMGRKLEVRVHIVTGGATATQNVISAVTRCCRLTSANSAFAWLTSEPGRPT